MLGLPIETRVNRQLPKKAIYSKFKMNASSKEKIDTDISRITITNEISPARIKIAEGEKVKSFFVVNVVLKRKDFDEQSIIAISKLIPQNIVFLLEYDEEAKLAVYYSKLFQTSWMHKNEVVIHQSGFNLDTMWENIVIQIGDVVVVQGTSLEDQIELDINREKLNKEIGRLEKLAWKEVQPKKKFELVKRINDLKKEREDQ